MVGHEDITGDHKDITCGHEDITGDQEIITGCVMRNLKGSHKTNDSIFISYKSVHFERVYFLVEYIVIQFDTV